MRINKLIVKIIFMYTEVTPTELNLLLQVTTLFEFQSSLTKKQQTKAKTLLLHITETITLGNKTLLGDVHMDYLL